jgi:hypothetical protein
LKAYEYEKNKVISLNKRAAAIKLLKTEMPRKSKLFPIKF